MEKKIKNLTINKKLRLSLTVTVSLLLISSIVSIASLIFIYAKMDNFNTKLNQMKEYSSNKSTNIPQCQIVQGMIISKH